MLFLLLSKHWLVKVSFNIRNANVEDARTIAEINVASWRVSYKGVLPDKALEELSVEQRYESTLKRIEALSESTRAIFCGGR